MSGKVGFWRWLLLKIWKGIKTIPKLPKLMKDIDPAVEFTVAILAYVFGVLLVAIFNHLIGLLVGFVLMCLIMAHSFYRMEMEGDC